MYKKIWGEAVYENDSYTFWLFIIIFIVITIIILIWNLISLGRLMVIAPNPRLKVSDAVYDESYNGYRSVGNSFIFPSEILVKLSKWRCLGLPTIWSFSEHLLLKKSDLTVWIQSKWKFQQPILYFGQISTTAAILYF